MHLRTQTVSLSGTGLAPPAFSVNPPSLTFTNQQPGVASAPQTLTITNNGGAPMANVGFQFTGAAAASYSVSATTCGALLNNGSSCTAQIVFTPAATGAIAATLAISSSTAGVAPVSVPLNGSGQLATGLATNPSQLTFPVVAAGQSSTAQPVTVTNSSSYAIGSVALAATAPFNITQNTCTGSLAAGANCTRFGGLSAQRWRLGLRHIDGQLRRRRHAGHRRTLRNRLRFHRRLHRPGQPDRGQRPAGQLHAC